MDKFYTRLDSSSILVGETIHCGNIDHANLKITIKGVGLDAEDSWFRFHESDDGIAWIPCSSNINVTNGTYTEDIQNYKRFLMAHRNPMGLNTTGHIDFYISTN